MSDTKGTINIDKVKKCITRIINNSQDTPYIDHFGIIDEYPDIVEKLGGYAKYEDWFYELTENMFQ
jgi:hypothetical protein